MKGEDAEIRTSGRLSMSIIVENLGPFESLKGRHSEPGFLTHAQKLHAVCLMLVSKQKVPHRSSRICGLVFP